MRVGDNIGWDSSEKSVREVASLAVLRGATFD